MPFDAAGNVLVGGGDTFSSVHDDNYFALVRASAVSAALAGGSFTNGSDTTKVRKLDPNGAAGSAYAVGANAARAEVYAVAAGSSTAFVYSAAAPVPTAPPWALGALAASLFLVGFRRRQSAEV